MSQDDLMTVEGHLDSVFIELNSNQPDPSRRVTFYRATNVAREKAQNDGWVYTARLTTNVGRHDVEIRVQNCSDCWAVSITFDGVKTL